MTNELNKNIGLRGVRNIFYLAFCLAMFLFISLAPKESEAHVLVNIGHAHYKNNSNFHCVLRDPAAPSTRITKLIISCIDVTLDGVAREFYNSFFGTAQEFIHIMATFGIMIIAIRAMFGYSSMGAHTALLLFKIIVVFAITSGTVMQDWRDDLISGTMGISNLIISEARVIDTEGRDTTSGAVRTSCDSSLTDVFDMVDCTALQLLGMSVVNGELNTSTVMLGFVAGGLFFTGAMGMFILLATLGLIVTMVLMMYRIVMIYVVSMFAITILMGLAPIILPFMFFDATKQITKTWFLHILNYSLQPIFLFTFLILTLAALDMISSDMEDMYEDAIITFHDPKSRVTTTVWECKDLIPDMFKATNDLSASAQAKADEAAAQARIAENQGKLTSDNWYVRKLSAGLDFFSEVYEEAVEVVVNVAKEIAFKIASAVLTCKFEPSFLDWDWEKVKRYVSTLVAGVLMMLFMLGFLVQLPKIVDKMTAASGGAMQGISNVATGAVGKAAAAKAFSGASKASSGARSLATKEGRNKAGKAISGAASAIGNTVKRKK